MHESVVRDDIRHREDPAVTRLGEHIDAGPGQSPARPDQRLVDPVHPPDHPAGAGQVELGHRGARQDPGPRAGRHQLAHRGGVQPYVGVEVDPGKGDAGGVAQPERVWLAALRSLDHPHAGDPGGRRGGAVGAVVGDHDDVELARGTAVEEPSQIAGDDGLFVAGRHHDADYGLGHAAHDSGYRRGRDR
jgi:hypothetical protein